jgi:hypothetical protein
VKSVVEIEAELTAPGGAFDIVHEDVLGESIKVLKHRDHTLREILEKSVNHADNEYLICEDQRISFGQHLAAVSAVAHNLRHTYGVRPGDRVAILADNHPQWIITFWATVSIGAICAGLNGCGIAMRFCTHWETQSQNCWWVIANGSHELRTIHCLIR